MSIWLLTYKNHSPAKMLVSLQKKISQKYKKMRSKRTPIPFNLARLADTESITSANDTNLRDVTSSKGAAIPAKKYLKNIKR